MGNPEEGLRYHAEPGCLRYDTTPSTTLLSSPSTDSLEDSPQDPARETASTPSPPTSYEQEGEAEDHGALISLCRMALARPETNAISDRWSLLNMMGYMLMKSFSLSGNASTIDEAIKVHREALEILSPCSPVRTTSLNNLAQAIFMRFEQNAKLCDLDETVQLQREALALRPAGHDGRPVVLNNLAVTLFARFQQLGGLGDLDEAVNLHREALAHCPEGSSDRSLNNLASTILARFERLGDKSDLEDAVKLLRGVLDLRPSGHPQRFLSLMNLSSAVHLRFSQFDPFDLSDLEEVVQLHREALSLVSPGYANRASFINNLAVAIHNCFDIRGGMRNLEEAIRLYREALALRPPGHVDRLDSLNSIASALLGRYHKLRLPDDLDEVIGLHTDSLMLCPLGHPDRPRTLVSLADSLLQKFELTRCNMIASESRKLMIEALDLTPLGHATRSVYLSKLALLHLLPDTPFTDVDYVLQLVVEAIADSHCHPRERLSYGVLILEGVEKHPDLSEHTDECVLNVYTQVVRLLPRVAYFGLDVRSRLDGLWGAERLGGRAASHAIRLGQLPRAIELLEEGRGVFWSQALRLRTQFDAVPAHLRSQLVQASRRLEGDSFGRGKSRQGETDSKADLEAQASERRKDSERFEALIEEVKMLPGFDRFMLHDEYDTLAKVAAKGPVIVLVGTKMACAAILINSSGEADRVDLQLNLDDLCGLSGRLKTAEFRSGETEQTGRALKLVGLSPANKILGELWTKAVKPIVIALGLTKSTGRSRPRIWWCPTGEFVFLPIHAAGIYTPQYVDCCSDYFVSSYTPTLTALLNARRDFMPIDKSDAKVLAAASPVPYRGSRLPSTVTEMKHVKSIVPPELLVPLPAEDDCSIDQSAGVTKKTMQELLPKASILHLSCHGVQDRKNALDSGFILRDSMLTVSDLMAIPLPRAFLAFLNACETAQGDKNQPDQAIHLAATMLFAGFRSVVATMWEMFDCDGPTVVKAVYGALFKASAEILDPDDVPYALDAATREMRARKLSASHWATFIHLGM